MKKAHKLSSILSPYRVLDLTDDNGLYCGSLLACMGADVIKIEKPGGDKCRNIGPFYKDLPHPEKSLFWFANNIGKRGITLDIETTDGQRVLHKLLKNAHFLIESFPLGYLDNLNLGYSALKQINPGIIFTSITPFGQSGPYKDFKTSDLVANAMGGLVYISGDPDRPPLRLSVEQAYLQASVQAATGIMIAHYYRELTGEGQHIDVSTQESILASLFMNLPLWYGIKKILKRTGHKSPRDRFTVTMVYPCKDGFIAWRVLGGGMGSKTRVLVEWMSEEGMAGELDRIEWSAVNFDEVCQAELEHWEELFSDFFLKHTKKELYQESIKRDFFLFPVYNTADVLEDPQLKSREYWVELAHPELNTSFIYPGAPFKSDETAFSMSRRAPLIGEHNEEIYVAELGFSRDEVEVLKRKKVI